MNKILIIDDYNEIELPQDMNLIVINSDEEELFNSKFNGIKVICINRNLKNYGISQLVRLLNRVPHFKETSIIVIADWIRNYEVLSLESSTIDKYITLQEFDRHVVDEILSQNIQKVLIQCEPLNKLEIMNKLVFSHNSKENMINSYILESALKTGSVKETIHNFFNTLNTLSPNDIIIVLLKEGKETNSYCWLADTIKKPCFDDFNRFCLHNHHDNFHGVNIEGINHDFLSEVSEEFYNSMDLEKRRISSYYYSPIYNSRAEPIGTVHVGNFINNYFNNSGMREKLTELFYRIGEFIDNSIEFRLAGDQRKNTLSVFSKFIPEGVIHSLLKEGEINRSGEVKRICVLFSDIRSFTTISERNNAEDVVRLLNSYFNIMVKCIRDQGGTIDKFIGDAIMAMFGAPDNMDEIERKAVMAATNMINSLNKVDTRGITLPEMGFKIGVGIHVGNSIVGNIGSKEKKAYTSIGDIATIAEELEGLTKKYKEPILITSNVAKCCNSRKVDNIDLDGKSIDIFTVTEIQ